MEWRIVAALGVGFAAVFGLKFIGSVQPSTAREPLRPGARVIDVRSPEEFRARHLPVTITIPLGELSEHNGRHVTNKEEILLLHCLGGGRTGLRTRWLRRIGYRRVYNPGSYRHAESIVGEAGLSRGRGSRPQAS